MSWTSVLAADRLTGESLPRHESDSRRYAADLDERSRRDLACVRRPRRARPRHGWRWRARRVSGRAAAPPRATIPHAAPAHSHRRLGRRAQCRAPRATSRDIPRGSDVARAALAFAQPRAGVPRRPAGAPRQPGSMGRAPRLRRHRLRNADARPRRHDAATRVPGACARTTGGRPRRHRQEPRSWNTARRRAEHDRLRHRAVVRLDAGAQHRGMGAPEAAQLSPRA